MLCCFDLFFSVIYERQLSYQGFEVIQMTCELSRNIGKVTGKVNIADPFKFPIIVVSTETTGPTIVQNIPQV